jgi:serine palmitoyltransferase
MRVGAILGISLVFLTTVSLYRMGSHAFLEKTGVVVENMQSLVQVYFGRMVEMFPVLDEYGQVLVSHVELGWQYIKPGGTWHPAGFIEHKGHLVLEALLILIIVRFMLQGSSSGENNEKNKLTEGEIDELCDEWEPEPLAPKGGVTAFQRKWLDATPTISSHAGRVMTVNGVEGVLDFCTTNFLSIASEEGVQMAGQKTLDKYGVGSCGPRGFYGTLDVHLELEDQLAAFFKTEEAILYSYDAATVPSVIPAFANAKDIVVIDDGCANAVRLGCNLSRAKVVTFKHNDVDDLETKLAQIVKEEKRLKKPLNRRFVVVEGIYHNTGEIAPLKEIVRIKNKYKFRLVVDESLSVGVLGKHGRGAAEHCGVDPSDVDIVAGSLGNAVASIGGFCAGAREMVDHQRLSGLGYCFSASLPPYLASTTMAALDLITGDVQHKRATRLAQNAALFRKLLGKEKLFDVVSPPDSQQSPLIHVRLAPVNMDASTWDATEVTLQKIVDNALQEDKMLFSVSKYSKLDASFRPPPSIKVTVSSAHTEEDIKAAVKSLVVNAQKALY